MSWSTSRLLLHFFAGFAAVVYFPGLPPRVDLSHPPLVHPRPFSGSLTLNHRLDGAEHLYKGLLDGPECLVFKGGAIYTGLNNGRIVRVKDRDVRTVVELGTKCDGLNVEECGRPLGMKFGKDGLLYAADAYLGIFRVDVDKKTITRLVSNSEPIEGKVPKFFNSVEVSEDGSVFWTHSSSDFSMNDGGLALIARGTGRLLKYNPQTNTSSVLMDNIFFANGLALSKNEDFIIVSELLQNRILRYYLKGPLKGSRDVFIDGLPGTPDNIKRSVRGGFYVALIIPSVAKDNSLLQVLHKRVPLSTFFARTITFTKYLFQTINSFLHLDFLKLAELRVSSFFSGVVGTAFTESRQTAVELSEEGEIVNSFHCQDESVVLMSDFSEEGDHFYMGSPFVDYIARVKKS